MSEDSGEITGGGEQRPSSAVPATTLEDNNLLSLVLCRLPSVPPSLLRTSLVCKSWHSLISDPHFIRNFRAHQKKPPLLGFFSDNLGKIEFTTVLGPSDSIPAERFSLPLPVHPGSCVLRSHHGHVLVLNQVQRYFLVWDPVTGEQLNVAFPPALDGNMVFILDGGVVCAATDRDHVHGACHSDPFRLVFIGVLGAHIIASVYSSETLAWGNLFSIMQPPYVVRISFNCPSTLLGNSICMSLFGEKTLILQFDWGRGNLALIDIPSDAHQFDALNSGMCHFMITPADDSGGLNFYLLSTFSIYVWKRVFNRVGIARWVRGNTIELGNLCSQKPTMRLSILGLDEDNNMILKFTDSVVFTVNLESMEFKTLSTELPCSFYFHPFKSFYTPGIRANAGHDDVKNFPAGA
ncbi:unnamed protein product [Urochloa decumbens]|uniref:F-box domain-containing protein n=1 Tax=Urochloa decumbens TaxID=240449 RepID=A0ABC8YEW5_9POAL